MGAGRGEGTFAASVQTPAARSLRVRRTVRSRIHYREVRDLPRAAVVQLYRANGWSSARKPVKLPRALRHSHTLISAWDGDKLVGLGNTLSDGHLVVYYSHLLVLPEYQGRGIGRRIVRMLKANYRGFHQHVLLADAKSVAFWERCGFKRAGKTQPMWIYAGHDH
ncbi:MAG: GNAT family N-acetyltransferase [Verrucomicrobia bacterium]|nr:GNAT family N-acetyltransferase [Verrucomicrobiota bacterium]